MLRKQDQFLSAGVDQDAFCVEATAFACDGIDVDTKAGIIRNAAFISAGIAYPAMGEPFEIDDVMLEQVVDSINSKPTGVKCRLTHPEIPSGAFGFGTDPLLCMVGRARNARIDNGVVRGDIDLAEYANLSPTGKLRDYLLAVADKDPTVAGLSVIFRRAEYVKRDGAPPLGRIAFVRSVDFVGDPAANRNGLLAGYGADAEQDDADRQPTTEDGTMNEMLRKYLVACGMDKEATDVEAMQYLQGMNGDQRQIADALVESEESTSGEKLSTGGDKLAESDKTNKADEKSTAARDPNQALAGSGDQGDQGDQAVVAERVRFREINGLAKKFGLGDGWAAEQYLAGTSTNDARMTALEQLAAKNKPLATGHVEVGRDLGQDGLAAGISDAILLRANRPLIQFDGYTGRAIRGEDDKPKARQAHERAREFRGLSMVEIGRTYLTQIGIPGADALSRTEVVDLILSPRRMAQRFGYGVLAQSTGDFPFILEDTMRKSLRAAYEEQLRTWRAWARMATNPDFKQIKRLSLSESPDLVERPEGKGISYVTLSESRETYALTEYSGGIRLTRRALINDDLDAFSRIPQLQAAAAARKEDDVVYAVLTGNANMSDAKALFHAASHSNLATGGDVAAPSVATLNVARAAMRTQKGLAEAAILNIRPAFIIHPASLEGTVDQLLTSAVDPAATAANILNTWQGKLTPVPEPRLDANSTTAWYLAAESSQIDTVEICFLEDEQVPQLKQETEFDTGDAKFAVTHNCAAKAIDWRGLYKNAGA